MKKRIFSFRLYAEGLRDLWVIGAIVAVLIVSLYCWKAIQLNTVFTTPDYTLGMFEGIFIVGISVVLSPVFVLRLFRFLHKRPSTDLYFSLPQSRLSIYLSYFAAAMTWVLALLLMLATVIRTASHLTVYPPRFFVNTVTESGIVPCFVMALLSGGAAALASAVTGRAFGGVAALALILFFPRLLVGSFVSVLYDRLPLIRENMGAFALWQSLNPMSEVFNELLMEIGTVGYHSTHFMADYDGWANLYMGVLGLLYAVAGGVAFCRRRGEAAETALPGRGFRGVCRVALTLFLCLPACCLLVERSGGAVAGAAVLYGLALLLYFAFEWFATHSGKALLRAIPGLLIVAVFNLAFIGGAALVMKQVWSFTPSAEEITSVRFYDTRWAFWMQDNYDGNDYQHNWFRYKSETIELDSPEIREMVAKKLLLEVQAERAGGVEYLDSYGPAAVSVTVNGKATERTLYLYSDGLEKLKIAYRENEEFQKMLCELPALDEKGVTLVSFGKYTGEQAAALYEVLREETNAVSRTHYIRNWFEGSSAGAVEKITVELRRREQGQEYTMKWTVPTMLTHTYYEYATADGVGEQERVKEMLTSDYFVKRTLIANVFYKEDNGEYGMRTFRILPGPSWDEEREIFRQLAPFLSPSDDPEDSYMTVEMTFYGSGGTKLARAVFRVGIPLPEILLDYLESEVLTPELTEIY